MMPFHPMNAVLLSVCLDVFSKVNLIFIALIGLVFMIRTCWLLISFSGGESYGELLKDTVCYLALSAIFPMLVRIIFDITEGIAKQITFTQFGDSKNVVSELLNTFFEGSAWAYALPHIGGMAIMALVQSAYSVFIALLLGAAPVFLFLAVMLRISLGLKTYFSLLFAMCLWPVLWNIIGTIGKALFLKIGSYPLTVISFWIILFAVQILSPIICFFLFSQGDAVQTIVRATKVVTKI